MARSERRISPIFLVRGCAGGSVSPARSVNQPESESSRPSSYVSNIAISWPIKARASTFGQVSKSGDGAFRRPGSIQKGENLHHHAVFGLIRVKRLLAFVRNAVV